ncbi:MAG TPA: hypothetical protein VFZ66_25260 [Herpetosiphonaceae bacterium]
MLQAKLRSASLLSAIIAILAAVASSGGLLIASLYRDNSLIIWAFRGNDLVTLAVAVPLLVGALILTRRGSQRALLIWLGALGYMLYNYIFYLYGTAFNQFFLLYVALFTLSAYALIFALPRVDASAISRSFKASTPVTWISGWMLFFAALLGGLWIARSLQFVVTGQVPQDIIQTGHPTAVVYATDLSLLMPGLVLSAVLLWKRQPWGYVLATIVMVKATTYGLALLIMSAFAYARAGTWDTLTPLWAFLTIGCLIATGLLLGNMQPAPKQADPIHIDRTLHPLA